MRILKNENGQDYYILFGKEGDRALLCGINVNQYVVCGVLEKTSWFHGTYFENFDEAYKFWGKEQKNDS